MAVIITDMDMPKGCWGCKYMKAYDPETDKCMLLGTKFDDRLDLLTSRLKDCPLKSADKMIKEIEEYNNPLIGKNVVLDIIHKYTDKEAKDVSS